MKIENHVTRVASPRIPFVVFSSEGKGGPTKRHSEKFLIKSIESTPKEGPRLIIGGKSILSLSIPGRSILFYPFGPQYLV